MAKNFRFQFSLTNHNVAEHLLAVPTKYRSLYLEMVLDAWFNSEQSKDPVKFNSKEFSFISKENPKTTRFRLSIINSNIIISLRSIPPRHRSFVTQMALITWIKTKTGIKMFEIFTGKSMSQSVNPSEAMSDKIDPGSDVFEVSHAKSKKTTDTEQLMRDVLEFD